MPPPAQRILLLNIGLGTLVVAVGFWLLWGTFSPWLVVLWALLVAAFLHWKCRTITEIWAWSTLLLGLESFAWPLQLMIQLKSAAAGPSDEEMGTILSAVVLGLFSSVFWMSFSYGLFKRKPETPPPPTLSSTPAPPAQPPRRKKR
ncbi:MAG: hypothetical protein IT389_06775 [Nitrospira sp.]|nr:hypothetical protein [Nitrospira sp.]